MILLAACNGDDGDGGGSGITSCGDFNACGGDVIGTWIVRDFCTDDLDAALGMSFDAPECRNLFQDAHTVVSGMYTFDAGGTVSWTRSQDVDFRLVWTPSCLRSLNNNAPVDVAASCANIDADFRDDPRFMGSSCVFDGNNCDCAMMGIIEKSGSSTYQVRGTQVLQAGDEPADFCVSGETLTILSRNEGSEALVTMTRQ